MAGCFFCQWQQKKKKKEEERRTMILANAYEKTYWVLSRMVCFGVTVKLAKKYWKPGFSRVDILLITIRIQQSIEFSQRTR